ncbi:hypothetical protein D9756_010400 [Leucocoprinus leucothites]|uniref:Uncharacterized protein n=1 Tax=Leucocoprinus leucothites TaxID=201217 RepID=A0A8H5CSS9_9AGAR|nr:hypothetical protein D9756_010400 [Leucoagaricus leucothites]
MFPGFPGVGSAVFFNEGSRGCAQDFSYLPTFWSPLIVLKRNSLVVWSIVLFLYGLDDSAAFIMASTSAAWFDCVSPDTLMLEFLVSPVLKNIPLPAFTSSDPFSIHPPSGSQAFLNRASMKYGQSGPSSSIVRKTVVSSAYRSIFRNLGSPGILSPLIVDSLIITASSSIARLNRRQDNRSPWRTPLLTVNGELRGVIVGKFNLNYLVVACYRWVTIVSVYWVFGYVEISHHHIWAGELIIFRPFFLNGFPEVSVFCGVIWRL